MTKKLIILKLNMLDNISLFRQLSVWRCGIFLLVSYIYTRPTGSQNTARLVKISCDTKHLTIQYDIFII